MTTAFRKRLILAVGVLAFSVWFTSPTVRAQVLPLPPDARPKTQNKDDETVRVRSDLVQVLVSVTNSSNDPVKNLADQDFELLENGVSQAINVVGREDNLPLRLVLMLDTSSSVRNRLKFEQDAAVRFFRDILRPVDRAAFYYFNHDVFLRQDLTNSLYALEGATRDLNAKGATAIYDAVFVGAQRLFREQGRRVIVIVSDGSNTVSKTTLTRALEEVSRADAIVYGINPAIRTPYDDVVSRSLADNSLDELCRQTGGKVFNATSLEELSASFSQLATELRSQYVLNYYSNNDSNDGGFRKIEVRVKRPGLKVRARDGYYLPQN